MTTYNFKQDEYLSHKFEEVLANLSDFSDISFDGCTFVRCDFSESKFDHCVFVDCEFIDCNLSVVQWSFTKLNDVVFRGCKLIGIDWTRVDWPQLSFSAAVQFHHCLLNDSSFMGLRLPELILTHCRAHDVNFREADFTEANFTETDFTYSQFSRTNLTRADFTGAINFSINLYENELKEAIFSRFEAPCLLEAIGIELVD